MTHTGKTRLAILALLAIVLLLQSASVRAQHQPEWTVATLARDGSWGVGTSEFYGPALASALRKCEAMSDGQSDCGAEVTAVKAGWTLGILCGDHRVLVAEVELRSAIMEAEARELYLRDLYGDGLPTCRCVFWANPQGFAAASRQKPLGAAQR